MKDQGLIHEITTSVSYVDKILWVATYFGASRYDGRYWHNFLHERQRPAQQFPQPDQGVDANRAWFSTDKGLAYYDGTNWAVYRPALDTHKPEMLVRDASGAVKQDPGADRSRPQLHSRRRFSGRRSLGRDGQRFESRHSAEEFDQQ